MADPVMQLEIVTPEGEKIAEKVKDVTAPGVLGELDILPGHVPILTVLDIGHLTYVDSDNKTHTMAINGGYLEVDKDRLVLITETAEYAEDVDVERARAALKRANEQLATQEEGSAAFNATLRSAKRAANRLAVAGGEGH